MPEADASQRFESVWAELKLLLEWRQGFAFYIVLGDDQRVSTRLRQRVEDFTLSRTQPLQWVKPEHCETLVETVLSAVLPPTQDGQPHADSHAPVWLELTAAPDDPHWNTARQQALAALNQRRSRLEQQCPRPLFLQLPLKMAPDIVVWAPDLWSIREYIALLPSDAPRHVGSADELRDLSISLDDVGKAERNGGRLDAALAAFRESLEICQRLRQALGDTPQVLRDLSVSFDRVGDAESDGGRLDAALAAYRESLEIRQRLLQTQGDTPQVLRDLSISLNKVGDAERDGGRLDAALAAYRQSLEIRQRLRQTLGDAPQVLRDLSISLNKVGDAESDSGRLDEALAAYRESLEIRQRLRQTLGDTQQVITGLAIGLRRLLELRAVTTEAERAAWQLALNQLPKIPG